MSSRIFESWDLEGEVPAEGVLRPDVGAALGSGHLPFNLSFPAMFSAHVVDPAFEVAVFVGLSGAAEPAVRGSARRVMEMPQASRRHDDGHRVGTVLATQGPMMLPDGVCGGREFRSIVVEGMDGLTVENSGQGHGALLSCHDQGRWRRHGQTASRLFSGRTYTKWLSVSLVRAPRRIVVAPFFVNGPPRLGALCLIYEVPVIAEMLGAGIDLQRPVARWLRVHQLGRCEWHWLLPGNTVEADTARRPIRWNGQFNSGSVPADVPERCPNRLK